jgi:hypothetical protein
LASSCLPRVAERTDETADVTAVLMSFERPLVDLP